MTLTPTARPHVRPRASRLPAEPTPHVHFLRLPGARWWRGVVAVGAVVAALLALSSALTAAATRVDLATGRLSPQDLASGDLVVTPLALLALNLSLAALVPLAMLAQWALFGQRPRWLSSVSGGFRWRWALRAAVVVVPLSAATTAALTALGWAGLHQLDWRRVDLGLEALAFLVVVLATTPLQAMGEEYGFRGLLQRVVGSWWVSPSVAWVASTAVVTAVFVLAHGSGDPWLNAYYASSGVALSLLVQRTGGLEAGVVVHAATNVLLVLPAALLGQVGEVYGREAGAGSALVLLPVAVSALTVVLVDRCARRTGVRRLGPPAERRPAGAVEDAR